MSHKVLTNDLDNYLINFDRKVLVTNLLDKYGGVLEEIARIVVEFLAAEEAKGKKFLKTFILKGLESDSENEVITVVPEDKLKQREAQLRDVSSFLYSAEADGGSKLPPYEFVPLTRATIKLNSLIVNDATTRVPNGSAVTVVEDKQLPKKVGPLGAMFKKQETVPAKTKKSPEKTTPNKAVLEKKPGALGAMFKKQEAVAAKKSPKSEPEKKTTSTLSAMFKKQESTAAAKKSPETMKPKKGMASFLTKNEEDTKCIALKSPTSKKVNSFFKKNLEKEEPAANVSVNLFEESSSSSDDEETLDALKREVLTDDEGDKPSNSNKRRRIIDSEDEDTGPEVKKVEVKEEPAMEVMEIEEEKPKGSETFMDEDGFIVTVKAKRKSEVVSKPRPTPVKVKKESPKSPSKKEAVSKTSAAKSKQGNIMSFFTKK